MRRLRGLESTLVTNSLAIIKAAFVLHNSIMEHEPDNTNDDYEDDDDDTSAQGEDSSSDLDRPKSERNMRLQAQTKRDTIAAML